MSKTKNFKTNIIIGIAGATCTGKTTISNLISEHFKDECCVIHEDFYYDMNVDNCINFYDNGLNWEIPNSINEKILTEHLTSLSRGFSIESPVFDCKCITCEDVKPILERDTVTINPHKIIIAEGLNILNFKSINEMCNLKIYTECNKELMVLRRIRNTAMTNINNVLGMIDYYENIIIDANKSFIFPQKSLADYIINTDDNYDNQLQLIYNYIDKLTSL